MGEAKRWKEERRMGEVEISGIFFQSNPDELFLFLQRVLVVRCERRSGWDALTYVGYSSFFDPMDEYGLIPKYNIIYTREDDKTVSLRVERIKDS